MLEKALFILTKFLQRIKFSILLNRNSSGQKKSEILFKIYKEKKKESGTTIDGKMIDEVHYKELWHY